MGVWTKESKPTVKIAFDNAVSSAGLGSTGTYTHQVIGTATVVFVGVTVFSATVTSVTYGGVSMTQIGTAFFPNANSNNYIFYLINPPVGTNTIVVHNSLSTPWISSASSYIFTLTSGIPDNSVTNTSSGSTLNASLTPVVSNCWTLAYAYQDSATISAGTGSTARGTPSQSGLFDSNGVVSGSTTMNFIVSGTNASAVKMISFAPALTPLISVFTKETKNVGTFIKQTKS